MLIQQTKFRSNCYLEKNNVTQIKNNKGKYGLDFICIISLE